MFFNRSKEDKIRHLKNNALIVIILLGLAIVAFLLINQADKKDIGVAADTLNIEARNEAEKLKAGNKAVIENANTLTAKTVRGIDETDHYKGSLDAPIQLIIYSDFECPFCAGYVETVDRIEKEYGDKIVIAFRHFPLRSHPNALPAALASECAAEQGKFWEMHDKIFAANQNRSLNIEQYKADAGVLGLDEVEFAQCLDTAKYKNKIQDQLVEARNFSVTGTPASFLNEEILSGAMPYDDYKAQDGKMKEGMKSIIERHLQKLGIN